ncbi:hypothetical protein [Luteibacter sp. RCC_6_2]
MNPLISASRSWGARALSAVDSASPVADGVDMSPELRSAALACAMDSIEALAA